MKPPADHKISLVNDAGELVPMEEIEALVIQHALDHYQGSVMRAAAALKLSRTTVHRKRSALRAGGASR